MRQFVDASFALMVRMFAAIPGTNLIEAIDRANETFGIENGKPVEEGATDDALAQLTAMRRAAQ